MVSVEVRAYAGHGIGVVCGCSRVAGTAGGVSSLRRERTRCAYGRNIGRCGGDWQAWRSLAETYRPPGMASECVDEGASKEVVRTDTI